MKIVKNTIFIFLLSFVFITTVDAASFQMTSSTKEISPNGTFTVTIGGDCIGRVDLSISNGTSSINNIWVEQGYISIQVTAGSSGVVTVTATPLEGFSDSDANQYNPGSRSISVNIVSKTPSNPTSPKPNIPPADPLSSNNHLSSLNVNVGALSPSFQQDQTKYTLNLPADIQTLTLNATLSDPKAKIEGIGEVNVKPGHNPIVIRVFAEDGTPKEYIIDAYVDDTPLVYLEYQNEKIGIIRNFEDMPHLDGFETHEYIIDSQKITIFSKENLTIVYGLNTANEKNLYFLKKENNKLEDKLTFVTWNQHNLYITDRKIQKENLVLDQIELDQTKINCYKLKNGLDHYCLFHARKEDGTLVTYSYEPIEKTIQLYYENPMCSVTKKSENTVIFIGLSILFVIIYSVTVWFFIRKKKGEKNEKTS